jgi:beta-glucanase (GH16 family)
MTNTLKILIGSGLIMGSFFIASCSEDEPIVLPFAYVEDNNRLEGNSGTNDFTFRIKLVEAATETIRVDYETQDITATAGEDYEATSGIATIVAGSRETTFTVKVFGDVDYENDETFKIKLSNASGADVSNSDGTATIRNDDSFVPTGNDGYETPLTYLGYTLMYSDEFDGTSLNTANWNYETGNHGWGNNELQNYQAGSNNITVNNGKLVIEAREENGGYTSARITTQGKKSFKYGRIDIRARLPFGQGIWPALWMLGDNINTVSWPACGEIDIMEMVGHQANTTHGTVHWDNNGHAYQGGSTSISSGILADEFHVYTIIWDANQIKWLLDDVQFYNQAITASEMSEFHNNFFFIMNVAVGGNWPGYPDATTTFPQRMIVDYVRVFQ